MLAFRETLQLPAPLRDPQFLRCADRETVRRLDLEASFERRRLEGERALREQLARQRAELLELLTGFRAALRNAIPELTRACERALVALARPLQSP